jgi:hypothetical protein
LKGHIDVWQWDGIPESTKHHPTRVDTRWFEHIRLANVNNEDELCKGLIKGLDIVFATDHDYFLEYNKSENLCVYCKHEDFKVENGKTYLGNQTHLLESYVINPEDLATINSDILPGSEIVYYLNAFRPPKPAWMLARTPVATEKVRIVNKLNRQTGRPYFCREDFEPEMLVRLMEYNAELSKRFKEAIVANWEAESAEKIKAARDELTKLTEGHKDEKALFERLIKEAAEASEKTSVLSAQKAQYEAEVSALSDRHDKLSKAVADLESQLKERVARARENFGEFFAEYSMFIMPQQQSMETLAQEIIKAAAKTAAQEALAQMAANTALAQAAATREAVVREADSKILAREEAARKAEEQALTREEAARKTEEQALLREKAARKAEEQALSREETARRSEEKALLIQETAQKAQEHAIQANEKASKTEQQAIAREAEASQALEQAFQMQEEARKAIEQAVQREESGRMAIDLALTKEKSAQRALEQAFPREEIARNAEEQAKAREEIALKAEEQAIAREEIARKAEEQAIAREEIARKAEEEAIAREAIARKAEELALAKDAEAFKALSQSLSKKSDAKRAEEQALEREAEAKKAEEQAQEREAQAKKAQDQAILREASLIETWVKDTIEPRDVIFISGAQATKDPDDINQDVLRCLADNLEAVGVDKRRVYGLGAFLLAARFQKVNLILAGYGAVLIADALSATLCNKMADRCYITGNDCIDIPSGNNVLAVFDAFGCMNKIACKNERFVCFIAQTSEELLIEPRSIYNYALPVLVELFITREAHEGIIGSIYTGDVFANKSDRRKSPLPKGALLPLARKRLDDVTNLANRIQKLSEFDLMLLNCIPVLSSLSKREKLEEIIASAQLTDEEKSDLKTLLGETP